MSSARAMQTLATWSTDEDYLAALERKSSRATQAAHERCAGLSLPDILVSGKGEE